jgi:hypothetical protein
MNNEYHKNQADHTNVWFLDGERSIVAKLDALSPPACANPIDLSLAKMISGTGLAPRRLRIPGTPGAAHAQLLR